METHVWLKTVFCLLPVGVCIDAYVMIGSYVSLITHLQLKKTSVIHQSSHVAITFHLLDMSSITTPNQTISNIRMRYKFFKEKYQRFTDLHNEKNQIWKFRVNGIVSVIGTCVNVYQIL